MKLFPGISKHSWVSTIGNHGFSADTADTRFLCAAPPNRAPQETAMRQGASGWVGDDMLENPIFRQIWGLPTSNHGNLVKKHPRRFFPGGNLVKTFQTIYKRFWCKNDMKQCSNVKHVQKLCNYVYLYVYYIEEQSVNIHGISPTAFFDGFFVMFSFYLFFQGCATGKNSTSKKQSLNSQPNLCHKLFEGRFLRELLPYWRGTSPNFQPPNREVAINSMKLHIPPLRVPAHRGWRPVARRDYGVKNISSVLNCWCKIVESKNVTTILLVGWFREWCH